jgi:hypothetical protein
MGGETGQRETASRRIGETGRDRARQGETGRDRVTRLGVGSEGEGKGGRGSDPIFPQTISLPIFPQDTCQSYSKLVLKSLVIHHRKKVIELSFLNRASASLE